MCPVSRHLPSRDNVLTSDMVRKTKRVSGNLQNQRNTGNGNASLFPHSILLVPESLGTCSAEPFAHPMVCRQRNPGFFHKRQSMSAGPSLWLVLLFPAAYGTCNGQEHRSLAHCAVPRTQPSVWSQHLVHSAVIEYVLTT